MESQLVVNVVLEIWVMIYESVVNITTIFRNDSKKLLGLPTTRVFSNLFF